MDFGLVHATGDDVWQPLTHPGTFAGTPRYASPEQARAESVGPASDLYALGLSLFEMLAGRLPQSLEAGEREAERLRAATGARVPPEIDELVASLLERDPAGRPASAESVFMGLSDSAPLGVMWSVSVDGDRTYLVEARTCAPRR
jgi:serine/threonine-protein kinase